MIGSLLRFSRAQLANKLSEFCGQWLVEHRTEVLP